MNSKIQAFTNEATALSLELMSYVGVGLPIPHDTEKPAPLHNNIVGLWDTGATGCAITKNVAELIGAVAIGQAMVGGVHDSQYCNQYLISLFLPNFICIPSLYVTELGSHAGCDILIGMDVIGMGDFSTSSLGGKTSFTFRIPTYQKSDFAKYLPKDNYICTCGSGKMFKNCCKKFAL